MAEASKELTIKIVGETKEITSKIGDLIKSFEGVSKSTKETEAAFQTLKIKSVADMEEISQKAKKAFEDIKSSGTATPKDISNAHSAMTKIVAENSEKQVTLASRISGAWSKVKAVWVEIALVIGAVHFLKSWIAKSIEAEEAARKLKIQIENLGIAFESVAPSVDVAIQAASRYGIVQKEEVQKVLQQLIFITGDLEKSQKNLNLVYDLAYLKGVDASTAAFLIGKAITGNIEMLARYFPELHRINEELGENATQSQKAAIGIAFLAEKVEGATNQMTKHKRLVLEASLAWENFQQSIGDALLTVFDKTKTTMEKISDIIERHTGTWANSIKVGLSGAFGLFGLFESTKKKQEEAIEDVVKTTGETAIVIEDAAKKQEQQNKEVQKSYQEIIEVIEKEGKEAKLSGEQILSITKKVTEAIDKQGDISKFTAVEKVKASKEINDLIEKEIKLVEERAKVEKDAGEKFKKIQDEIIAVRLSNYKDTLDRLKGFLSDGLKKYNTFKDEVAKIESEILRNRETAAAQLKAIEDKRRLPAAIKAERVDEARDQFTEAQKQFDLGNFQEAADLAAKARDEIAELGKNAVSAGEKIQGTQVNLEEFAKSAIVEAQGLVDKALGEIKGVAEAAVKEQDTANKDIQGQIDDLAGKIKGLIEDKKQIEFELLILGYEEALTKKAELEKATSSTHTIYVSTVQAQSEGGVVIKAASGRHFPGYGGGDKIPILGEAGEFMNRKEAVRFWGVDLFSALNKIDKRGVSEALGVRKLAGGGSVVPRDNSGQLDKVSVDLNFGKKQFAMSASKEIANDFVNEIKKTNILRGRHISPY